MVNRRVEWLQECPLHRLSPESLADEVKDYPEPLRARVEAIGIGDGGRYARIRLRTKEDT